MTNENGVVHVRLRGANPQLGAMLPGLNSLATQCTTLGSMVDESMRYLASANLHIMTLTFHSGTGELTIMVR
jgi:hypothetical protein